MGLSVPVAAREAQSVKHWTAKVMVRIRFLLEAKDLFTINGVPVQTAFKDTFFLPI